MAAAAVARKYAVIVVGPHLSGPGDRCWMKHWPPQANVEVPEVRMAGCAE